MPKIQLTITSREKDLGGFSVRRILPYATHRMVGPFIFFDHMGPAEFPPGKGISVRPHPHINLATVTYLFEGRILHRDSLGSNQVIEPGAINWMTAGRGIVHSERTDAPELKNGGKLNGIQLWVALPEEHEETAPTFSHHPKSTLPEFKIGDASIKLLLGKAFGHSSPVPLLSDLFYAEVKMPKGASLEVPAEEREIALYVVNGKINCDGQAIKTFEISVGAGENLAFTALEETHLMIIGGKPVGERFIYWNFVSSSKARLDEAKQLWSTFPKSKSRFTTVPGDAEEFIPLPLEVVPPKGTIL